MKCYKCGSFLYDGEFCSTCGADVRTYRKIVLKSNDFYNSGLEYARGRNLSKAAEHLELSLKLYKGNINSHNLLGLVLFETGEYTRGFAHWVISKNIQPENNLASIFLEQLQEDKPYFEMLNDNIRKYNKAIGYVEQGSYDLAEIQLKKLINDNSAHMVDAYLLSALLRIRKKKYAAARKILSRVQSIDAGNPQAISYMTFVNSQIREEEKDLTPGEIRAKRKNERTEDGTRSPLSGDDVIIPKPSYKEYNPTTVAVIQILIGFLVGAALIFFIVVPAKTNAVRNEVAKEYAELEGKVADLTQENQRLSESSAQNTIVPAAETGSEEGEEPVQDADTSKDQEILMEAYDAFQNDDIQNCGTLLYDLQDPDSLTGADKAIYDSISYTMDLVPDMWYNEAYDLFQNWEYEEALPIFQRVYEVANTTGESLYYIALCYYNLGQSESARMYFDEYIADYPYGPHVDECNYLLTQL